jgi:hypothetical protein
MWSKNMMIFWVNMRYSQAAELLFLLNQPSRILATRLRQKSKMWTWCTLGRASMISSSRQFVTRRKRGEDTWMKERRLHTTRPWTTQVLDGKRANIWAKIHSGGHSIAQLQSTHLYNLVQNPGLFCSSSLPIATCSVVCRLLVYTTSHFQVLNNLASLFSN